MKDQDKDSKDKLPELRRRAELAAEKSLGISNVSALAPEKVQQLIHELQVHQIELEIQNEELRQTQLALEASRDKHVKLYDLAPLGYFVLDQKGVILEANLTGSAIFRTARGFLIGKPLASFVNEEDGDVLYLHLRQVLETQSRQSCDIRLTNKDGSQVPVRLESLTLRGQDGSPSGFRTLVTDISKRKHVEDALYDCESRYRRLFESGRDGILIVDFDTGKILDVNEYLIDMLGYSHEEFLDKYLWEVSPFKDTALNKAAFAELLEKGCIRYEDLPLETSDGRSIAVEVVSNSHLVCGVTFIQCNIRDITERKKAEEALQESEEQYRAVFDNAGVGIDLLDRHGRILKVNQALLNILGYAEGELSQRTFLDITHPDDREISKRNLEAIMAGEIDSYRLEKRYVRKDGSIVWAELWCSPIWDANGDIARTVAVIEDITEQKKAKEESREAEERLIESEKRYRHLVENASDIIYSTDVNGSFTFVNPVGLKISGYSTEEVVGKSFLQIVPEEFRQDVQRFYGAQFVQKIPDTYREFPFLTKQGNTVWLGQKVNLVVEGDRVLGFQVVARDITEQTNLQKQLLQAQKMEAIGTLTGGIAHDFNNLLTVVMGFSELLLAEKEQGDPEYADLQKIFHAAKNGADLVQRLLMFSRKAEPKPVPMNLNKQIVQVEKLLRRTIPQMVDIKLELSADLPKIMADPSQVEQVLINLAVNARDAMPHVGQLTLRTSIVTLDEEYCRPYVEANPGEYVLLEVSDTGHGMDKETVGHIFEPFFTTKEIGRGTGLGLAMVYGIVKRHNGHITVYSRVGKGTTFRVYLPVIPADMEPEVEGSGIMPEFGTETVLLVDDEDLVSDLGARILTKFGYTVIQAPNGREALDLFKKSRSQISLVILDLIMPEMGGKECLKEILKIDPQVKVLIASGYSADASVKETILMGAKGFVTKPFRMNEFLRDVRRVLDEG